MADPDARHGRRPRARRPGGFLPPGQGPADQTGNPIRFVRPGLRRIFRRPGKAVRRQRGAAGLAAGSQAAARADRRRKADAEGARPRRAAEAIRGKAGRAKEKARRRQPLHRHRRHLALRPRRQKSRRNQGRRQRRRPQRGAGGDRPPVQEPEKRRGARHPAVRHGLAKAAQARQGRPGRAGSRANRRQKRQRRRRDRADFRTGTEKPHQAHCC